MDRPSEPAAIYVRTAARDHERDALGEQETACRAHCAERGYSVDPARVYRDIGSGLSIDDRGGLSLLRDDVAATRVAVVVVLSPDRLSRDHADLTQLAEEAEAAGVRVEFVNSPEAQQYAGWSRRPIRQVAG